MGYKVRDVESSLEKKGFRLKNKGHRFYFYYRTDGDKTHIYTMTSHGHKEVSPPIFSQMAKQCKLTKKQFTDLIDCPLGQEAYENILREQGCV